MIQLSDYVQYSTCIVAAVHLTVLASCRYTIPSPEDLCDFLVELEKTLSSMEDEAEVASTAISDLTCSFEGLLN